MIKEKIKERMKFLGVNAATLCYDLKLSQSMFSSYINDKQPLPYRDVMSILEYFGLVACDTMTLGEKVASAVGEDIKKVCLKLGIVPSALQAFMEGKGDLEEEDKKDLIDHLGIMECYEGQPIHEVVKNTIKNRRMKVYEIGKALGIVDTSISSYINGKRTIKNKQMDDLLTYLGIELRVKDGFVFHSEYLESGIYHRAREKRDKKKLSEQQ